MKKIASFMLLAAVVCGGGCMANHLRDIDPVITEKVEKQVKSVKYELILNPADFREADYQVSVEKKELAKVTRSQVKIERGLFTPYSGLRKLYEVPAGFCLLPVAIFAHISFVVSLGIVPYSWASSVSDTSFAGMNPFMNWESESRTEILPIKEPQISKLSEKEEIFVEPLAKRNIIVKGEDFLSQGTIKNYKTDVFGGFKFSFLSLNPSESFLPTRKIRFCLAGEKEVELKSIVLTRDFISRIFRARSLINVYLASPSGKKLFHTVVELERMGFIQLAYSLEESELKRMAGSPEFQMDFRLESQK